jgi:predicted ATPase
MEPLDQLGPRLLNTVTARNLLSFGPDNEPLELSSLNVLIGPNGSGKSNLLEAIALLRTCPNRDGFRPVIARGGGVGEWIWKGRPNEPASVEALVARPGGQPLRHMLALRKEQQSFRLEDERIENERPSQGNRQPYLFYHYGHGRPVINTVSNKNSNKKRKLNRDDVAPDASILAQRRDPESFPEITHLADVYDRIRLYREWAFGRNTVFREPQKSDLRSNRLEEDFSNLGMFLNRLRRQPKTRAALLAGLADLYEGISDFDVSIEGGTVQVYFTEGDFSIPATRLSDGTVRYLCLLAILCDPEPPPLIGIEEPELGLHPDILPKIADLLMAASERTQLIVTTHSEILVDALTERPGAVVVCEKHEGQTGMRRLDPEALRAWLEKYRLGQLWMNGQLGGTRW